jgi:hypothetical protein
LNSSTAGKPNLSTDYEQSVHTGKTNKQVSKKEDFEKQKLFKCGQCEFYSIEKFNVDKHVKTAHKKPFKCSECDFMNLEKADVLKHIQMTHEPDNSITIEKNETQENNRIRALLGLPALNSNGSLATENLSKNYEVTVHEEKKIRKKVVPPKIQTKLFKCDECEYTNVINDYVICHMKTVHNLKTEQTSSLENSEVFSTDPLKTAIKTKKCSYCWIEVANRGHFNHEEACFRKFAKKANKKSKINK